MQNPITKAHEDYTDYIIRYGVEEAARILESYRESVNPQIPHMDADAAAWERAYIETAAAIITAQQPTETENAPQAITQAAEDTAQDVTPLQLETLAARLDRMTAAELVDLFAATSDPDTIDDQTDSALYDALHAINPRAYRVWMSTPADYTDDPASIAAADAADLARLRACYGV